MALLSTRSWDEWISEYSQSHQHPMNRLCHSVGIPMICLSFLTLPLVAILRGFWAVPVFLFGVGWIFQFVGHAYERKRPEFMKDWRFLFVGVRWWLAKIQGRA
jgi:uncharacterized membrane protein YGL010W